MAVLLHPEFPLFLLFLQEIISGRHYLRRRNPGVSPAGRSKEQRAGTAVILVNRKGELAGTTIASDEPTFCCPLL